MIDKKEHILKRFVPYMGNKKYLLSLALILSGIAALLSAIPFVLIWRLVRYVLLNSNEVAFADITGSVLWIGIIALMSIAIGFTAGMLAHLAAFRVEVGLQKKSMAALLDKPLGFFDRVESGKLRKVINEGAATTHNFIAHQLVDLSASLVSLLFLLVTMFVVDWSMGLAALVPLVLGMAVMMRMMGTDYDEFLERSAREMDQMSNHAIEYVRGIPVVKTFGGSVFSFKHFYDHIVNYRQFTLKYVLLWRNKNSFFTIIMQTATVFLAPVVIWRLTNQTDRAVLISNYIFYLITLPNFIMLMMQSANFQRKAKLAEQALDRIEDLLKADDLLYPAQSVPIEDYSLEFKDVVFRYPGATSNAIDGISFKVHPGERVALVGASGSGKTTIARLAVRFWDVTAGEILIGGHNITTIAKKSLMNNIAFVFQNTQLFSKSIRQNIAMADRTADEERLKRAIDLSMSRQIVDSLAHGVDTVIGAAGVYLSGGERQRISLARAIYKDAPLVVLDEATAFADPENEHLMQMGLRKLSGAKTTLMIVHRLSSIQDVDKILVIDNGKIVERGSHDDLMRQRGVYADMYDEYQRAIDWQLS